jgi:hypothetical protein
MTAPVLSGRPASRREIRWIDPAAPGSIELAPPGRDEVLPAVLRVKEQGQQHLDRPRE